MQFIHPGRAAVARIIIVSAAPQFEGGDSITTQIAQLPQGLFETAVMLS